MPHSRWLSYAAEEQQYAADGLEYATEKVMVSDELHSPLSTVSACQTLDRVLIIKCNIKYGCSREDPELAPLSRQKDGRH